MRKKKTSFIMSELPIGTRFWVLNGAWEGLIVSIDGVKYIKTVVNQVLAEDNDMGLIIEILDKG